MRRIHFDDDSRRLLDGMERCAHDITAMMTEVPDIEIPGVIDLAPLAARAGENTKLMFRGTVTTAVEPALVRAAAVDVTRLLNNLLENAVRAAMPNGTIELSVANEGSRSVIRLADSGPGFLDRTNGTGIGLAVVAALSVKLGGELMLGRSSLGGALIAVSLPRVDGDRPLAHGRSQT